MDPAGDNGLPNNSLPGDAPEEAGGLELRRLALIAEYDGGNYAGFQLQAGHLTVQGELERSLARFTGEAIRIRGASRTDAGVHARGQVVDFLTRSAHPVDRFPRALNYYLPGDIEVQAAQEVLLEFNSRRDAISRTYRYHILNRPSPSPLRRHTHFWVRDEIQVSRMSEAARKLVGTHDFRPLTAGYPLEKSSVRRVYRWDVWKEDDTIIFESEANGFLRHQIRRTNALLLQIGKGRYPESIIDDTLDGRLTGAVECPTMPARGLCLMRVAYPVSPAGNGYSGGSLAARTDGEPVLQPQVAGADAVGL